MTLPRRETPAETTDREMTRLHDLTQQMVYWIGSIRLAIERDRNLARPTPDFFRDVHNLRGAFETALPLARKHAKALARLRRGRVVTVAGVTAPSQTEAVVILAARLLRHIASCIPDRLDARDITLADLDTHEGMDPTEN